MSYQFSGNQSRQTWSSYPAAQVPRKGVTLSTLIDASKAAALTVVKTMLSTVGYAQVQTIQAADDWLKKHSTFGNSGFGSNTDHKSPSTGTPPSTTDPFMVQFGGHHLARNYTHRGTTASITPDFTGTEPETFTVGGTTVQPLTQKASTLFAAFDSPVAVGHWCTLVLGALGLGHRPPRLVEGGIALSVLVSALHAIRPLVQRGEVLIAEGFGLPDGAGQQRPRHPPRPPRNRARAVSPGPCRCEASQGWTPAGSMRPRGSATAFGPSPERPSGGPRAGGEGAPRVTRSAGRGAGGLRPATAVAHRSPPHGTHTVPEAPTVDVVFHNILT